MKKLVNGKYVEMTQEEVIKMQFEQKEYEKQYWANISYDDAVNKKIRERYTESQEFAILRQKDEKPDEYAEYYKYCEECKQICRDVFDFTLI